MTKPVRPAPLVVVWPERIPCDHRRDPAREVGQPPALIVIGVHHPYGALERQQATARRHDGRPELPQQLGGLAGPLLTALFPLHNLTQQEPRARSR